MHERLGGWVVLRGERVACVVVAGHPGYVVERPNEASVDLACPALEIGESS
ncbi:hypothetical protein ACFYXD_20760 [Streptomyces platensis]|uniref:hypothetical protein n=1 Tax=Streptomyces platensis TaxID=58346 RepID=UPI0036979A5A